MGHARRMMRHVGDARRKAGPVRQRRRGRSAEQHADLAQLALPLELNDGRPCSPVRGAELATEAPQDMVWDFHRAFGLPARTRPTAVRDRDLAELRVRLQREETEELAEALGVQDLVAIADALADILYVAYGTAVTYGIDLDAVVAEVHRSNMSKLGPDGQPMLRSDGKVLKPSTYRPPDIQSFSTSSA